MQPQSNNSPPIKNEEPKACAYLGEVYWIKPAKWIFTVKEI